jgi:hypothetical protein
VAGNITHGVSQPLVQLGARRTRRAGRRTALRDGGARRLRRRPGRRIGRREKRAPLNSLCVLKRKKMRHDATLTSPPSSSTNTSPCSKGDMVPASVLRYGSGVGSKEQGGGAGAIRVEEKTGAAFSPARRINPQCDATVRRRHSPPPAAKQEGTSHAGATCPTRRRVLPHNVHEYTHTHTHTRTHAPILMDVTRWPHAWRMTPIDDAVTPLPRPDTTPPVTSTYFMALRVACVSVCACRKNSGRECVWGRFPRWGLGGPAPSSCVYCRNDGS